MTKLKTLNVGLATIGSPLRPTTQTPIDRDQARAVSEPWRAWYHTKRWSRLRWSVLVRDRFTCQHKGCGLIISKTSDLVAHHKVRHRGNPVLFWDDANVECVCRACHDGPIKAAERAGWYGGGMPGF